MGFPNSSNQVRILVTVSTPSQKSIVATGAYFQYLATYTDRVLIAIAINEPIPYPDSLAKNAAAFFSISFSSFNFRFSSRKRFNSSTSGD